MFVFYRIGFLGAVVREAIGSVKKAAFMVSFMLSDVQDTLGNRHTGWSPWSAFFQSE